MKIKPCLHTHTKRMKRITYRCTTCGKFCSQRPVKISYVDILASMAMMALAIAILVASYAIVRATI